MQRQKRGQHQAPPFAFGLIWGTLGCRHLISGRIHHIAHRQLFPNIGMRSLAAMSVVDPALTADGV